jgi:hypothetical protein
MGDKSGMLRISERFVITSSYYYFSQKFNLALLLKNLENVFYFIVDPMKYESYSLVSIVTIINFPLNILQSLTGQLIEIELHFNLCEPIVPGGGPYADNQSTDL